MVAAGRLYFSMIPTGMPRPLSATVIELSGLMVATMAVQYPASASSTELSIDLVDEVMEASRPGGADVHAGPLADRLEALEDLDILGVVVRLLHTTSQWPRGWAV